MAGRCWRWRRVVTNLQQSCDGACRGSSTREVPSREEELSVGQSCGAVQLQQKHGRATLRPERNHPNALQPEMLRPAIATRVEQAHDLAALRVHGGDVWPFEPIAVVAGQRQVFRGDSATAPGCDDVVRFVRQEQAVLVDEAVFTAAFSALPGVATVAVSAKPPSLLSIPKILP